MNFTRIVAIAAIGVTLGGGASHGQTLRNAQAPAEFPPASYRGAQYVDSNGCVFIRAGIDGNTTWVPRVNRDRRLICGQPPSLTTQAAETARTTPRETATGKNVEQITVTSQADPVVQASTPAAATPATRPAPAPQRNAQAQPPAPPKLATAKVVPQAAPAPVATPRRVAAPTVVRKVQSTPDEVGPQTRVVPRQVYDARLSQGELVVPEGYRSVWQDGRLNPRRAEQSLGGVAGTRLVWTQTVPRRLIERRTGRDVTTTVALVFPFTDTATQQRDLGTVTLVQRDGQLQKRIVRNKAKAQASGVLSSNVAAAKPVARAASKPAVSASGRYVQIGTFGVPANARAAVARIVQAGLPTRTGKVSQGGKTYQVILAGPFTSSDALGHALKASRAAGFGDAFVR